MKKIKKGQIVIYAMSLMLVAAGYFNYITFENNEKTKEVYSEETKTINEEYANVGDAVLVSNNETTEEEKTNSVNNEIESIDDEEEISTNNNINEINTDYYVSSKLDREKMYAEMISKYEEILNNTNITEVQKNIITEEITKINNTKNAIMISENLILTKGFNNCVIFVNEKSVNVVVNITDGLKQESVAKIQNIIARELNTEIENIHITEK